MTPKASSPKFVTATLLSRQNWDLSQKCINNGSAIMKKLISILLMLVFFAFPAFALEIPVKGSSGDGAKIASGIIIIDMERLFNAHPMTARYKDALKKFAESKKAELDVMAQQAKRQEDLLYNLGLQISDAQNKNDQTALDALFKQFDEIKRDLDDRKTKMAAFAKKIKEDIAAQDEKNSREVLKDIDLVLKEILKKKDAQIVLDKNSVISDSGENSEDITDEVIKRLKGR